MTPIYINYILMMFIFMILVKVKIFKNLCCLYIIYFFVNIFGLKFLLLLIFIQEKVLFFNLFIKVMIFILII